MKASRKILSVISAVVFLLGVYVYYQIQFSSEVRDLLNIASPIIRYFFGILFFTVINAAGAIALRPALKNRYSFALLIVPIFQRVLFLLLDLLGALACYDPSNPAAVNFLSEEFTPYRPLMLAGFAVNVAVMLGVIIWKRFFGSTPEAVRKKLAENV